MRLFSISAGIHLVFAMAGLCMTSTAHAKEVQVEASSAWNLDYAANKCRLAREFGGDDNRHILVIEQYAPGRGFQLFVAGPSLRRYRHREPTDVSFSDSHEPFRTEPSLGDMNEVGKALIFPAIGLGDLGQSAPEEGEEEAQEEEQTWLLFQDRQLNVEAAQSAQFIAFRQGRRKTTFATGSLGAAFEALNNCTIDLMRDWGLDIEAHSTARSPPSWINQSAIARRIVDDYPRRALIRGEQGFIFMRAIIEPDGSVSDCALLKLTDADALESPACDAMTDARFEPALDAEGNPFRSFYLTIISYLSE
ncbi:MAG: TonB family protein [Erythrobacter sp.]